MFTTLQPTQKQYVQNVSENNTDSVSTSSLHCSQHRNSMYRVYQKIIQRLCHHFITLQPTHKQYVQNVSENIIKTVGQFITFQRTQKQYVQKISENYRHHVKQFILLQPTQKQYVQKISENYRHHVKQFILLQPTQKQYVQNISVNYRHHIKQFITYHPTQKQYIESLSLLIQWITFSSILKLLASVMQWLSHWPKC